MVSLLSFNTKKHRPAKNWAVAGGGDERVSCTGKNQEARGNRNARVPSLRLEEDATYHSAGRQAIEPKPEK